MESLRDIKQQIKAINSTKQMMLTMKMVSSARIRSAQQTMLNGRPFAQKMASLIDNLRKDIQNPDNPFKKNQYYRFFNAELGDENKVGLILITGDKGLCGAFNSTTLRESLKWIRKNKEKGQRIKNILRISDMYRKEFPFPKRFNRIHSHKSSKELSSVYGCTQ